ncbi:MAG: XdhC family protein [Gammaproteobacteria bacterium]|nr:XdhC family protein [Gammaproteobacteria bacterium]
MKVRFDSLSYNQITCISLLYGMKAANHQVITQTYDWLKAGQRCWLSTVVATYGSSPRPEGSMMVCNSDGHIVGSLSGGCVEEDLVDKLKQGLLAKSHAQFFRYGESDEEAEQLGLPCGGHLDIVIEPLQDDATTLSDFDLLTSRLQARKLVERTLAVDSSQRSIRTTDTHEPFSYDYSERVLKQIHGPSHQLFIIGASMVTQYVAELAVMLEYLVTVCDPREEMLDELKVAGIDKICDFPDDVIRERAYDSQTAIIALTHDPRIDDMGLLEAFETDAYYIGAMGSSRTSASRRERLLALDVDEASLARLHAPIGVPIGSKTPPEIAISILAEIIAERAKHQQIESSQLAALAAAS